MGDEVILQRTGRNAVTVQRQEKDAVGQIQSRPVDVYRNRWVIEQREFFEERAEAARIVRDDTIKPREARGGPRDEPLSPVSTLNTWGRRGGPANWRFRPLAAGWDRPLCGVRDPAVGDDWRIALSIKVSEGAASHGKFGGIVDVLVRGASHVRSRSRSTFSRLS